MKLTKGGADLSNISSKELVEWITRMQMVLSFEAEKILSKLMVDEHNIDGTVLQLTTFVLQDFFGSEKGGNKEVPFEKLHALTGSILQTVFEPFLDRYEKKALVDPDAKNQDDD